MTTRPHLLEQLAAAETNHAIAKDKADTAWRQYLAACDSVEDGYADKEILDPTWNVWSSEDDNRLYWYVKVDSLKAQLLERDEIAAAINAAKAEMRDSRIMKVSKEARDYRYNNLPYVCFPEFMQGLFWARVVLARQIVAHL